MKTLIPLTLIIVLAVACTSIPDKEVSANEQNPTATVTVIASILPSATPTKFPSQTPVATISVTAMPSFTPFPSPTLPPDCGITELGKPGTQTKENNHSILIEGTAILCNYGSLFGEYPEVIPLREAMLDLDSGITMIATAADIGFGVGGRMRFYSISEINNALISVWSLSGITLEHPPQPTFDQCKDQVNLFNNDNEPEYVCVISNEGHIARVKVEKYNPVQQVASMEISFITWEERVEKP
jgi:hypothetical protein